MQRYSELVDQLPDIKRMGWVKTHRAGNTGVGKTLEDLLNVQENNFAGPNGYMTELKSGRKKSNSRKSLSKITLFTKAPLPLRINGQLVEKFGRLNPKGRKSLHTTINAVSRNTLFNNPGFIINVQQTRIEISHNDYGDLPTPYWNRIDLENAFYRKYPRNLLYVKADSRGCGRLEEFHYNEAYLMSGFSFDRFVELLVSKYIVIEIRIGQYPDGKPHDHGTGFRIHPNYLDHCFSYKEKIL